MPVTKNKGATLEGTGGGGAIAVPNDLKFSGANKIACETARDAFFTANPTRKVANVTVLLQPTGASVVLQQWDGGATVWRDNTAVVQGPTGNPATNLVTSVAGRTGAVTLAKADVSLGNVDNTADAGKPVSGPQQGALDLKADKTELADKQDTLVSGDNIKSVNGESLVGAGNLVVTGMTTEQTTQLARLNSLTYAPVDAVWTAGTLSNAGNDITGTAANIVDGVTLAVGMRVLHATGGLDGIYEVTSISGALMEGSWTRAADMRAGSTFTAGAQVVVRRGTRNAGKTWTVSRSTATGVVGSNLTTWEPMVTVNGAVNPTAGDFLRATGGAAAAWSTVTAADIGALAANRLGAANGVAGLGADQKVPTAQLPDFVASVNGRSGAVTLTAADVGLNLVTNTADADKAVSTATQTALNLKMDADKLGAVSGVCPLDADRKVPSTYISGLSATSSKVVNDQAARLAWSGAVVGSVAVQTDTSESYVLSATPPSTAGNWIKLLFPASVLSVNGQTGSATLTAAHVGAVPVSAYTAKGTLLAAGDTVSTPVAISPGTNGQFLVYDSTAPGGIKAFTLAAASTIADNLTTNQATQVLSAAQGVVLKGLVDAKLAAADVVNDLTSGGAAKALSAEQGKTLKTAVDARISSLTVAAEEDTVSIIPNVGASIALPVASTIDAGLMSPGDKIKLNGIATAATALSLASAAPAALAATAAVGVGTTAARADHVHALPAAATTSVAGLMSAADKTKLDGVATGATAGVAATADPLPDAATAAVGTSTKYAREDHVHPGLHAMRLVSTTNEWTSVNELVVLDVNLPSTDINTSTAYFERTSEGRIKILKKGVYMVSAVASCSVFNASDAQVSPTNQGRWTVIIHNYTQNKTLGSGTGRFVTTNTDITAANMAGVISANANDIIGLRVWGNPGTNLKMKLNHVVGFVCDLNAALVRLS